MLKRIVSWKSAATRCSLLLAMFAISACEREALPARPASEAMLPAARAEAPVGADSRAECAQDDIECTEKIYQLEETLFAYEAVIEQQVGAAAQACWQQDVEAFREALDACGSIRCREDNLRRRVASLHYRQPDERRARIELPAAPNLLAVLGPVDETSSAPADRSKLFEVSGPLVRTDKHPEHMGIAVRDGESDHVFLFDMDIGASAEQDEVLGLVGTSPTTHVLVRGYRADTPTGVANFDVSQCRWVHELVRE